MTWTESKLNLRLGTAFLTCGQLFLIVPRPAATGQTGSSNRKWSLPPEGQAQSWLVWLEKMPNHKWPKHKCLNFTLKSQPILLKDELPLFKHSSFLLMPQHAWYDGTKLLSESKDTDNIHSHNSMTSVNSCTGARWKSHMIINDLGWSRHWIQADSQWPILLNWQYDKNSKTNEL